MKLKNKILSVVTLSVLSQTATALPFTFEGRSLGMGGVSVTTADLATAAWANPAMLTNQRPGDDFSLLIGVGAFIRDNDELIDDIDDFQAADSRRSSALNASDATGAVTATVEMAAIISGIDGKVLAPEVTGAVAMGMALDSFAMAISIRSDALAAATVTDLSQTTSELIDPNSGKNILNLEGLETTEFGLSLAKSFRVLDRKLSVGIKPKIVNLKSFTFTESLLTVDDGLSLITEDDNTDDLGTFVTIDLGVAMDVTKSVRVGLTVNNLITDDFDVDLAPNGGVPVMAKLNFDTEARLGIAYHSNFVTVAVDLDLTENGPLLANSAFEKLKTKYLAVGAEFNAFDFAQLRIGASKNIASGVSSNEKDIAYTAGVGFWVGFNLDIAATLADNSAGVFLQTGFRF